MEIAAHIGLLDDPSFNFFKGNYDGNIPKRISPYLPGAHDVMRRIFKLMNIGNKNARQLDWGAAGVILTKQQLAEFLDSLYKSLATQVEAVVSQEQEALRFIDSLEDGISYVLVAYETGDGIDD